MTVNEILDIARTVGIKHAHGPAGQHTLAATELQLVSFAETLTAARAPQQADADCSSLAPGKPMFEWGLAVGQDGRHRLVSSDGTRRTAWAGYMETTYLDGYIGATPFFVAGKDGAVMTPTEYALSVSVGEPRKD